jgi:hypothetical protein
MTDQNYPIRLVYSVCCLAGDPEFVDHRRASGKNSLAAAIERHDTARLFEWLVEALSYQGIADRIAYDYMQRHGGARWARISASLARNPSCPKLGGYWRFYDCRYRKASKTCAEPGHIDACPLPRHPLRNGHLNQMAYSLFLFMRDVADEDFVGWIDRQLGAVDPRSPDKLAALREAIIGPLRNVYGLADKVLAMARKLWTRVSTATKVAPTSNHSRRRFPALSSSDDSAIAKTLSATP